MWMIRKKFPAIALTVSALLSGCATITPVSGTFPKIAPEQAQSGRDDGKIVRWGGKLIETQPEEHQTCFTVLGEPLRHNGQPKSEKGEAHTGRFWHVLRVSTIQWFTAADGTSPSWGG